jgi:hypothetical protein
MVIKSSFSSILAQALTTTSCCELCHQTDVKHDYSIHLIIPYCVDSTLSTFALFALSIGPQFSNAHSS